MKLALIIILTQYSFTTLICFGNKLLKLHLWLPLELLHSNKEVVYHFQPNCTAQSGGNVVAPSITGSTITNLNFIITSTGQGRYETLD